MVSELRKFLTENVKAIVPVYDTINTSAMYNGKPVYATIAPASPDFLLARDLRVKDGMMFTDTMLQTEQ